MRVIERERERNREGKWSRHNKVHHHHHLQRPVKKEKTMCCCCCTSTQSSCISSSSEAAPKQLLWSFRWVWVCRLCLSPLLPVTTLLVWAELINWLARQCTLQQKAAEGSSRSECAFTTTTTSITKSTVALIMHKEHWHQHRTVLSS